MLKWYGIHGRWRQFLNDSLYRPVLATNDKWNDMSGALPKER